MRGRRSFQSPGHSQLTRVDEDVVSLAMPTPLLILEMSM